MSRLLWRGGLLSFLFLLALGCRDSSRGPGLSSPSAYEDASTYGRMTELSPLIVLGEVGEVKNWKGREDWWVVTIKPEQVYKGKAPSKILLLDQKLFPKQPSLFSTGEKVLVFLKGLPPYTAFQPLINEGVHYELMGKDHGLVKGEGEQKNIGDFAREFLNYLKKPAGLSPLSGIKDYFLDQLFWNPSKPLKADVVQEIFQRPQIISFLTPADLERIASRVTGPDYPDPVKIQIVRGIVALSPDSTESILKSFICLEPSEVCLRAAEALESRGVRLSSEVYAQALENASSDLKIGLLQILGRHQRQETFTLFEKEIAQEKDEKKAAAVIEALGELGGPRAEALVIKYGKDKRYYVRLSVVKAIGLLKSEKGIPLIEIALKTTDPTMVTVAAQALDKIGTPKAKETLSKYYEKEHHGYWEPTGPQHFYPKKP